MLEMVGNRYKNQLEDFDFDLTFTELPSWVLGKQKQKHKEDADLVPVYYKIPRLDYFGKLDVVKLRLLYSLLKPRKIFLIIQ